LPLEVPACLFLFLFLFLARHLCISAASAMASSKRMKVDIPCDLLRRSRRDRAPSVKLVELTQLGLDDMFVSLGSSAVNRQQQDNEKKNKL
jgi:hypothetical protein